MISVECFAETTVVFFKKVRITSCVVLYNEIKLFMIEIKKSLSPLFMHVRFGITPFPRTFIIPSFLPPPQIDVYIKNLDAFNKNLCFKRSYTNTS